MTELRSCLKKRSHISLIPPPDPTSKTPYITMRKSSKKMRSTFAKTRTIRAALSLSPSLKKQNVRSKTKSLRRVQFTPDSFSTETEVDSPDSSPRMTYGRRIPYVGGYTRPEFSPDRELRLPCDEQLKSNTHLVEVVATNTRGSKQIPSCSCRCSCLRGQLKIYDRNPTQRKRSYSSDGIVSFRSFFSPKMAPIKRIHSQTPSKEECEVRDQDPDEQLKKLGSLRREGSSSSDSTERFKSFFAPKMAPIKRIHSQTPSKEECEVRDQDPDEQLKKLGSLRREGSSSSDSTERFKSFFAPKMAPIKKEHPETQSEEKSKVRGQDSAEQLKNFSNLQGKRRASSDSNESFKSFFAPKMAPIKKIHPETVSKEKCNVQGHYPAELHKNFDRAQRKRSSSSDSNERFKSFFAPKMAPIKKEHPETQSEEESKARGQDPAEQLKNVGNLQRKRSSSIDSNERFKSFIAPKKIPMKKMHPEVVSKEKGNAQGHYPADLQKNFDRVQRKRSSSSDINESYRSSYTPKMTPAIKAAEQLKNFGNLQSKRSLYSDSNESFQSFFTPTEASITNIHPETTSKVKCNAQGHYSAKLQKNYDRVQRKRSFSSDFDESCRGSLASKMPPIIKAHPETQSKEECSVQSNKKLEEKTVSSNFISSHKKSRNTITSLTKPPLTVQYKPAQQNNFSKFIVSQNFSLKYHDNKEYSLLGKVLTYFEVTSKRNFGKKALLPTPMDILPIPLPYYIHRRR